MKTMKPNQHIVIKSEIKPEIQLETMPMPNSSDSNGTGLKAALPLPENHVVFVKSNETDHSNNAWLLQCLFHLSKSAALLAFSLTIAAAAGVGATMLSAGNIMVGLVSGLTAGGMTYAIAGTGLSLFGKGSSNVDNLEADYTEDTIPGM